MAAAFPELAIGFTGVALTFGFKVITMVYAILHISGCHLNPPVSIVPRIGGGFNQKEILPYIAAHVLGGIAGAGILFVIA